MAQLKIDYQLTKGGGATGEPIRMNTWEVMIPRLDGARLHSRTFTLPNYTAAPIEIFHFNEKTKIAGAIDLPNLTLEVIDTVEPQIAGDIWDWWIQVYNPETGEVGYASEYKEDATLELYDSKGSVQRSWELKNIWPTSYNPGSLDYSSAEPIAISVEFSIDRAIQQL